MERPTGITTRSNFFISRNGANRLAPVVRAEFINPFIESVYNLFQTLMNCEVKREEISLIRSLHPTLDIVGLIGLSGNIRGIVAMAFPVKTALAMVSRIYETEYVVVDSMVIDAVSEFVNVMAGGAQAILNEQMNDPVELSIPTVIRGNRFNLNYPSLSAWIEVPFSSELGEFMIRVTMNNNSRESVKR
jgi:chemotaxis protein CheX